MKATKTIGSCQSATIGSRNTLTLMGHTVRSGASTTSCWLSAAYAKVKPIDAVAPVAGRDVSGPTQKRQVSWAGRRSDRSGFSTLRVRTGRGIFLGIHETKLR